MRLCTFVVTLSGTVSLCSNSAKRRSTGWIPSTIGPTGLCMLSKGAACKSAGMSGGMLSALQAHPQMRSWHIIYRCFVYTSDVVRKSSSGPLTSASTSYLKATCLSEMGQLLSLLQADRRDGDVRGMLS